MRGGGPRGRPRWGLYQHHSSRGGSGDVVGRGCLHRPEVAWGKRCPPDDLALPYKARHVPKKTYQ
jgi:hypothetical protein